MINSTLLLTDLKKLVIRLEDDLRLRCNALPEVDQPLREGYEAAKAGRRTAKTYAAWRDEELTQVAVGWVLATVFVRFIEDNGLIEVPVLAGPGARLQRARDEQEIFFRAHPTATEREYFEKVFGDVGQLPAMKEFFDRRHNPLWKVSPPGDAAKELLDFWRRTDPETGTLRHDFTDPDWNTRFLGDLYQDLSEAAKKTFALLQTPEFIESFILDRTLTPATETFGFQVVRMIDPTCGSGHFLLGAFERLFRLWQKNQPGENPRVLAQKVLDAVCGVDLNPYAVAIARFRLLLAALKVCDVRKLKDAPDFRVEVTVGDSLLHGRRFRQGEDNDTGPQRSFDTGEDVFRDELAHHYEVEDGEALHRILGRQYHAVVGNPPYITVKDRALSELYRARYGSCKGKYSLSVPFMERFFDLAVSGVGTSQQLAGFVGQITSNSFMKREFGKKLIEEYLPRWDLTHVLDTSVAYIPGHGTPTVILFGKNQPPVGGTIRTVLGITGEPATPTDPALGLVWQAIGKQIDVAGSESEWVSAADSPRVNFHRHPWSIGGGGAAGLKEEIEDAADGVLAKVVDQLRGKPNIGITAFTLEDDIYVQPELVLRRHGLPSANRRVMVEGDTIREWVVGENESVVWPYTDKFAPIPSDPNHAALRFLWRARTCLAHNFMFGRQTKIEAGLAWYEFGRLTAHKLMTPLSITFGEITTHNHFVLDHGGKVFKQTAPVIKLKEDATKEDHIKLLGVLNSSTACFWLRQVCFPKGGDHQGNEGARVRASLWDERFAFNATQIATLPIPEHQPTMLPTALVQTSTAMQEQTPSATLAGWCSPQGSGELRARLASARDAWADQRRQLIAWQEELDWQIYGAFGLIAADDNLLWPEDRMQEMPSLELGQRTFEIFMARQMHRGTLQTTWFERHKAAGSRPITEPPSTWPADYLDLFHRRFAAIQDNPNIRLIEQPEYKRRWNTEPWDEQLKRALQQWLLLRLETYFFESERMVRENVKCEMGNEELKSAAPGRNASSFAASGGPCLVSTNQLAEAVQSDAAFLEVAEIYHGSTGFSVPKLVRELVEAESVPNLPVHRYKESGLRKREDWEHVWELQRAEDAIENLELGMKNEETQPLAVQELELKEKIKKAQREQVGDIPVPPKYASTDFKKATFWKLRGKLDVPKERWIVYTGAERDGDPSPLIAWAGWNHLQQAKALSEYYLDAKQNQGWPPTRLRLLLSGILELLPWLKQWHNAPDPDLGMGLGDYFAGFLEEECRGLSATVEELDEIRTHAEARGCGG